MFDASKMYVPAPIFRTKMRLMEMMHPETLATLCLKVVGDTLVVGLKGDRGWSVSVRVENDGTLSLTEYSVSGKTTFDALKEGKSHPSGDKCLRGAKGLSLLRCLDYVYDVVLNH